MKVIERERKRASRMAGRQYSVEDVLAYMEIPLPEDEDDDFSGDEFDGYISEEDDRVQGGDGYESEGEDGSADVVGAVGGGGAAGEGDDVQIPAYEQPFGCTQDMSDKPPLEFFKLMVTDDMLQTIVEQTNLTSSLPVTILLHAPGCMVGRKSPTI